MLTGGAGYHICQCTWICLDDLLLFFRFLQESRVSEVLAYERICSPDDREQK
jgi:hypothetical protein